MNRLTGIVEHFVHRFVQHIVRHAAELRTRPAVGRAVSEHFGYIAPTRITHAQGAVHKRLEFDIGHRFMDSAYLVDTEFACQYNPLETQVTQVGYVFGRTVIALRGSVQTNRRKIQIEQMQILNDEGIDTYFI